MSYEVPVPVSVVVADNVPLSVDTGSRIDIGVDMAVVASVGEHYDGPYQVTPGDAGQVLATAGKILDEDIVIERVPNTYGRITWDGSVLTVY